MKKGGYAKTSKGSGKTNPSHKMGTPIKPTNSSKRKVSTYIRPQSK